MTSSTTRFHYSLKEAQAIAQLVDLLDNKLKPFLRSLNEVQHVALQRSHAWPDARDLRSVELIESSMKSLDRVIGQIEECQAM